jgi:hypothetical protein
VARGDKQRSKEMRLLINIGSGFFAAVLMALFGWMGYASATGAFAIPDVSAVFALETTIGSVFMMGALILVMLTAAMYVSVMLSGNDSSMLLGLPLTSPQIYAAKFATVYVFCMSVSVVFVLPQLVGVGIAASVAGYGSAAFWFIAIIGFLLTPLISTAVLALFTIPLAFFSGFFKKQAGLIGIIALLIMGGLMFAYMVVMANIGEGESILEVLRQQAWLFPPGIFIGRAMAGVSVAKNFFIYLGMVLGAFGLTVGASLLGFRRMLRGSIENSAGNGKVDIASATGKAQGVMPTLLGREFKTVMRDTTMLFQTLSMVVLLPVMALAMRFIMNIDMGGDEGVANAEYIMQMTTLSTLVIVVLSMICSSNFAAQTALSRERHSFYMLKMMPIDGADVVKSKLLFAEIIMATACVLTGIVVAITISPVDGLLVGVLSAITGSAMTGFHMRGDLKSPRFDWVSVNEMFKGRKRTWAAIGIAFGLGIVVMLAGLITVQFTSYVVAQIVLYSTWALGALVLFGIFRLYFVSKNRHFIEVVE